MAVKPIPDQYHSVQPYLVVDGAEGLIQFLRGRFELEDPMRMPRPDGTVGPRPAVPGRVGDARPGNPRCAGRLPVSLRARPRLSGAPDGPGRRRAARPGDRPGVAVLPAPAVRHRQHREGPDPRGIAPPG